MEITGLGSLKACLRFSPVPFGIEWEAEFTVLVIFNQTHSFRWCVRGNAAQEIIFGLMMLQASKEKPALWGHFPVPSLMWSALSPAAGWGMKWFQPAAHIDISILLLWWQTCDNIIAAYNVFHLERCMCCKCLYYDPLRSLIMAVIPPTTWKINKIYTSDLLHSCCHVLRSITTLAK